MPAKPLTHAQLKDAERLKAQFRAWQAGRMAEKQPWSQDWASDQLKFGQSALAQYLNGKIPLNPEAAAKFAGLLGCSVSDFSPSIAKAISALSAGIPAPIGENDDLTIPQYDTGGGMGNGLVLRDQPGMIHSWRVTPEWVQKNVHNFTSARNLAIVTGFGDSMRPLYNPGDPLLVDRGVTQVEFDGIYFFRVGDEGFVKRLQRIPGVGLRAISENKSYESWDITAAMDFEVFARVIKVWRGEDF